MVTLLCDVSFASTKSKIMKKQKTWLVTGASKGLGLSLVKQLLIRGDKVAATSRSLSDLTTAVGEHENFLPLSVDIKSERSILDALEKTVKKFETIDVVVNNAGYGLAGSVEELTDSEVRANFDVNVFGSLNIIRQTLPYLREQGSGHIFNISSIGGFTGGFPGWSIYCATKFAVQGFTEGLSVELKPFGIHVTDVAPGYFRTNFLASDSMVTPKHEIAAYKEVRASQKLHQKTINGNQPGDPEKAVAVIIEVADAENLPLHLFLGQDAYDLAYQKIEAVQNDLAAWKDLATATSFAEEVVLS